MSIAKRLCKQLDTLKATSSTNDKVELLKEYLKDPSFETMAVLALTSTLSYNMKTVPPYTESGPLFSASLSIDEVFKHLSVMAQKNGASDADKMELAGMLSDAYMHRIVSMIVKKKLDCGVSAKLINKAKPNTVFTVPYMRCSTTSKLSRIKYPAILDLKADGMFVNALVLDDQVQFLTRTGNNFPADNYELKNSLVDIAQGSSCVFMGELRVSKGKKFLPRKEGNGLLNSILQGGGEGWVQASLVFTVWDLIPYDDFMEGECDIPYKDRLQDLLDAGLQRSSHPRTGVFVNLIESQVVESQEEAFVIASNWIDQGEEGGILKNMNSRWKNHTSTEWIKLKSEKVCELRVVGWEYAEEGSKFDGLMGAVICESEDSKVRVKVSGFNDAERAWNWDEHVGKIMSVVFNEVIDSKSKNTKALFLPRVFKIDRADFVEFRTDRTEADTLEYIQKL